jgi:hypothetical protein
MNDVTEVKKAKDRSPTFPFITLEQALERARQFYVEEKRGVAPYSRAVMHWKYSASSSGALQTVGALKSYGLLTEVGGSGINRQLRLTELALRILLDQRPDSTERLEYIREAALTPTISAEVYAKWSDGLPPSDSTINHFLVLDKRFNEGTAFKVVKIIKENHILAKLSPSDLSNGDKIAEEDNFDEIEEMQTSKVISRAAAIGRASSMEVEDKPKPKGHAETVLGPNEEIISIQFSEKPTVELYEFLSEYAVFKVATLRKKIKSVDNAPALQSE